MLYLQIALLSLFGMTASLPQEYVKARMYFEGKYYPSNTLPRFRDRITTEENQINSSIRVQTQWIAFKFLQINMGAMGEATKVGWGGGSGYPDRGGWLGGIWGIDILVTKGLELSWEHNSRHCGDTLGRCGSYDYIGFKFMYGYNDADRKPLIGW